MWSTRSRPDPVRALRFLYPNSIAFTSPLKRSAIRKPQYWYLSPCHNDACLLRGDQSSISNVPTSPLRILLSARVHSPELSPFSEKFHVAGYGLIVEVHPAYSGCEDDRCPRLFSVHGGLY